LRGCGAAVLAFALPVVVALGARLLAGIAGATGAVPADEGLL
jgi:hypothetical protein